MIHRVMESPWSKGDYQKFFVFKDPKTDFIHSTWILQQVNRSLEATPTIEPNNYDKIYCIKPKIQ